MPETRVRIGRRQLLHQGYPGTYSYFQSPRKVVFRKRCSLKGQQQKQESETNKY